MTPEMERLRSIKTFPSLVKYLRDTLDWPIDSDNVDELTFDYEPEEIGLDAKSAAKVRSIKQLRPFPGEEVWGIFYVDFEPKRLPVVVLRRILQALVMKKRQSAAKSHMKTWRLHDLLFINSYGENDERAITFAHFKDDEKDSLPTLKVIGWDTQDTALHIDQCEDELAKLRYSEDLSANQWRQQWAKAFTLRHGEVITTSKALAERMAELATSIRARVNAVLKIESENGPIRQLHKAVQQTLIHDMKEDDFADMYAQTITYGLFSAACSRPVGLVAGNLVDMIPLSNPFLKDLLTEFLRIGGRKGKIDFDELGVHDVVEMLRLANIEAVKSDFDDRNPQHDPVIHFYELFLKKYDTKKKMQRGVFYTPKPVVSYIVRSVHEILQKEFGLPDGLADTTTWGQMLKKHPEMKLPTIAVRNPKTRKEEEVAISENEPFVKILDPATGTGTFLVEAIDIIHKTMHAKWEKEGHMAFELDKLWNDYVPAHLLPRLYGFELMMAPYAIAHMKIGLKLAGTRYRGKSHERVRIYLTNSLEQASDLAASAAANLFEALGHEAQAVNAVKRHERFTVVIGNPPYSVTSANTNPFIDSLMNDYKKHVRGEQGLVALADDYLKFIRFSQELLRGVDYGVWGMITNHGYLKGVIHRGVRAELLAQLASLSVLDLHGDSNIGERAPEGMNNENVFDIQQGVSVSIGARSIARPAQAVVRHSELWGTRSEKYEELLPHRASQRTWATLRPCEPNFFLIPFDDTHLAEYRAFPSIDDFMPVNSCGVKTHRDGLVIDCDKKTLLSRILDVASERRLEVLRERYGITDTPNWRLKEAQAKIKAADAPKFIHPITYRPFDCRWIYYNRAIIEKGDSKYPTLRHMLESNLALLSARIQATGVFDAVFVSQYLVEMKTAESSRSCTVFPLYLAADSDLPQGDMTPQSRRPNLNPKVLSSLAKRLGVETDGDFSLPGSLTCEDIFSYMYGVLHSPGYRSRYAEFLKTDFPRLPLTSSIKLFRSLAKLGGELVSLHLMESEKLDKYITKLVGPAHPEVEKVSYSDKTVWIDKAKTAGFSGVPQNVWEFHIGGYQVCQKWLKDRKGRKLSKDDIEHYQKIVVALSETIRLMKEIDEVIESHGGWPAAFAAGK